MRSPQGQHAQVGAAYERVRADVLAGNARDALCAFAFHGMWQGLQVLTRTAGAVSLPSNTPPAPPAVPTCPRDRQLVRLLADMVLATQLEEHHVH